MDRFGGMYCCLGGLMGPPQKPRWLTWGPWWGMGRVEKKMVWLLILGQHFQLLPTIEGALEKWIILGVCIAVWEVWWGPPMFPNGSYGVPGEGWGEWRKKMVRLGILGRRFQFLHRKLVNWFTTIRKVGQKTWNGHKNFFSHPNDSPVGLLRSHKSILWPYYSHVAWTFLKSYHSFKDGVLLSD